MCERRNRFIVENGLDWYFVSFSILAGYLNETFRNKDVKTIFWIAFLAPQRYILIVLGSTHYTDQFLSFLMLPDICYFEILTEIVSEWRFSSKTKSIFKSFQPFWSYSKHFWSIFHPKWTFLSKFWIVWKYYFAFWSVGTLSKFQQISIVQCINLSFQQKKSFQKLQSSRASFKMKIRGVDYLLLVCCNALFVWCIEG